MRLRALMVLLLAAGVFVALYAVGRASEDEDNATDLVAPAPIDADLDRTAAPPRLAPSGSIPSLKPAPRQAPAAAPTPASTPPAPAVANPEPAAPAPAPGPEPQREPAPARERGQPFYDDG